jgi:hypothetical protein
MRGKYLKKKDESNKHYNINPILWINAANFDLLIYCVSYKKGCTRLAAAWIKIYQLFAHGRWFSPGTPASSTTKTGRHDIAESGVKCCNV